jgi:DNA polymerase III subunit delta
MAIHLFTGDDETLLANAMNDLVHQLVGDGDRSLMVDDFDGEDYELRLVVDAAQTAPFLTEKRIVIARGLGRFNADEVSGLVRYLADPLPSTELILSSGGGRLAKSLTDAIKAGGGHVAATGAPTQKKDRSVWIEEQIATAGPWRSSTIGSAKKLAGCNRRWRLWSRPMAPVADCRLAISPRFSVTAAAFLRGI